MQIAIQVFKLLVLVAVQILVLNNIYFWQLINPLVYIYFIIKLPYQTPRWALLVWAFVLGFSIDVFCGTPGMNAAATLAATFVRPVFTGFASGRRDYEGDAAPSARQDGSVWYSFVLTFTAVHHLTLYFLEDFGNGQWGIVLMRTASNTVVTVIFITLIDYLFAKPKD